MHGYKKTDKSQDNMAVIDSIEPSRSRDINVSDFLDANFGDSKSAEQSYINKKEQETTQNSVSNDYSSSYNNINSNVADSVSQEQENKSLADFTPTNQASEEPTNNFNEPTKDYNGVDINKEIDKSVNEAKTDQIEDIDLTKFELPKTLQIHTDNSRRSRGLKHSENQQSVFNMQSDIKEEDRKKFHVFPRYVCPTIDLLTIVSTEVLTFSTILLVV